MKELDFSTPDFSLLTGSTDDDNATQLALDLIEGE